MNPHDVILAVASPPGRSLRGIIRISGEQSFDLIEGVIAFNEAAFDDRLTASHIAPISSREEDGGDALRKLRPTRSHYLARLKLPPGHSFSIHAFIFPAPHSYTGEDSVEIQLPGNPELLGRIINHLIVIAAHRSIPARRAEPGEFTARAFFNNRLTLTQAEGVAATIAAQSDAELRAAKFLTAGSLGQFAHTLADDLANALALVEAGIDFTDQEDVIAIAPEKLLDTLRNLHQSISKQLSHAVGSEQLRAIPWVVLRGRPNAGKSALFNALLGHERAVVSPIAGTTRDVLAEPLTIQTSHGPGEVMLVDLAGVDDDDDSAINQLMQIAAGDAMTRAELVMRCVPINEDFNESDSPDVIVRTKCDLVVGTHRHQSAHRHVTTSPHHHVHASAVTGQGVDELQLLIASRLADRAVSLSADATALRPRHEAALRSMREKLDDAISLVAPLVKTKSTVFPSPELIAASMRAALDDLGSLAGDLTPDDVLGRVFSTFCVGK